MNNTNEPITINWQAIMTRLQSDEAVPAMSPLDRVADLLAPLGKQLEAAATSPDVAKRLHEGYSYLIVGTRLLVAALEEQYAQS